MSSLQLLGKILLYLSVSPAPGYPSAFTQALLSHHHYLLALLRFKTGDESLAEDLLQETYLAFLSANPDPARFNTDKKLKNYLITIALNKLRSHFRGETGRSMKKTVFRTREDLDLWIENLPSRFPEPSAVLIEREDLAFRDRAVALAMERIPDRQRQVLELKFTKGLENPEIGAALDLGIKAVESLLFRAKAQFKKEFEKIALSENGMPSAALDTGGKTENEHR